MSQEFFPADFEDTVGANYGPLMIRLAWHCSGSYRNTDGRGGCDGGRIRHDPERSWPDNANLDKALKILEPVKKKYGSDLSWGDLIILAGNAAIESMGGPILGFCGGRIDDIDGSNSLILGPSSAQEELTPCIKNGECTGNLGPTTVGLIYINPAGHLGNPDPSGLIIDDMRSSFGKMGMNDTETLALAGGGHAFGKCHGACADPPCGDGETAGKSLNTFTSGFEGSWTTVPTTWTNEYFTNLFEFEWNQIKGPGGNPQWAPSQKDGSGGAVPEIMMLTSDIALTKDPGFRKISQDFATSLPALEDHFKHAWYKLTSADMGPVTRCLGDDIPPAQAFQSPLPKSPGTHTNFIPIREKIETLIDDKVTRGAFIYLAYKCASTFRETDYQGGCNGAHIRFDDNQEIKDTIGIISTIKAEFSEASISDLIVLAGQVALEDAGSDAMVFCGGRTDASDNSGRAHLKPIVYDSSIETTVKVKDTMNVKGLTASQGVALAGVPSGSDVLDNTFFLNLVKASNSGSQGTFEDEEWALVQDAELKKIVESYAENKDLFRKEFTNAWSYLMTADRFDGPTKNVCDGVSIPKEPNPVDSSARGTSISSIVVGSFLGVVGITADLWS